MKRVALFALSALLLLALAGCSGGSSSDVAQTVQPLPESKPLPLPTEEAPEAVMVRVKTWASWRKLVTLNNDFAEYMQSASQQTERKARLSLQSYMAEKCRERTLLCNTLRKGLWTMNPNYGIEEYVWDETHWPMPRVVAYGPVHHQDLPTNTN